MKIKTTLLKVVTLLLDCFTVLFGFMLIVGIITSIHDGSIFTLQITTSIALYLACLVVLGISYYFYRIFNLMDTHKFFSELSLHFVKTVRYLFITLFIVLLGTLPFIYYSADHSDSPGVLLIALAVIFVPLAIAAFVSVMEKVLINSIQFKKENDLTI